MTEKRNIKNSSGKCIGSITKNDDSIIIKNNKKPEITITDPAIVDAWGSKTNNIEIIQKMYDEYILCIGEIACILDVIYCRANQWVLSSDCKTSQKFGRRNSSYGATFSETRIERIKRGQKRYHDQFGYPEPYERTSEIRKKISDGVKKAQSEGRLPRPRDVAIKAWKDGKFSNVDFGHGIGGYITSIKMNKRFFFRSLLELAYILKLESDDSIVEYKYEPFHIPCDDGTSYTPDFFINNTTVIELKSYKFVYKQPKILEKFKYKVKQAVKYCKSNNLKYKVIFDNDIDFRSDAFKIYIKNATDVVEKYQIEFRNPERIWS